MMTVRYPRGLSGSAGLFLEVFLKESKAPIRKEEHQCETATGLHKTKDVKEKECGGGALSETSHPRCAQGWYLYVSSWSNIGKKA